MSERSQSEGASALPTGLSPFGSSQQAVSPVPASIPCAVRALERIAGMTDIEADFDGFEARTIAREALARPSNCMERTMNTDYNGADKDVYIGRYLREFDRQLANYPSVDLRSALGSADAHWSPDRSDPEEDAREEADCWRDAS